MNIKELNEAISKTLHEFSENYEENLEIAKRFLTVLKDYGYAQIDEGDYDNFTISLDIEDEDGYDGYINIYVMSKNRISIDSELEDDTHKSFTSEKDAMKVLKDILKNLA